MMRQIQQNKTLRELFDMEETPAHVPKMDKSTRVGNFFLFFHLARYSTRLVLWYWNSILLVVETYSNF